MIKVHFVCLGNTYRSRLAEAYMKSLDLPGFSFSSSGLTAGPNTQSLPEHTTFIATKHRLNNFLSDKQTRTSPELLQNQDLVVFMNRDIYQDALQAYKINPQKCLTWDINDLWHEADRYGPKRQGWNLSSVLAEETFRKIKQRCDILARHITKNQMVPSAEE